MAQTTKPKGSKIALGFLLVVPLFIGYALLSNFPAGGGEGATYNSLIIFYVMGGFAWMGALYAYLIKYQPFKWWDGEFTMQDWAFVAIGFIAMIIIVFFITTYMQGPVGIIIALTLGGIVLAGLFWKSQNILMPILAHAIYNVVVIVIASGALGSVVALDAGKMGVPTYAVDPIGPQDLFQQLLIQLTAVGMSEEILKVSTAIGLTILLRTHIAIAMLISVLGWATLHSTIAYPVIIDFSWLGF